MGTEKSSHKVRATRQQIAGAREFLGLTQGDLARIAEVGRGTLVAFEKGTRPPHESTVEKLQHAIELRGIVFTNGDKPGFYFDKTKGTPPT